MLLSTAGLATLVGLDDYASILISGSAMQPVAFAFSVEALKLCWVLHGIGEPHHPNPTPLPSPK